MTISSISKSPSEKALTKPEYAKLQTLEGVITKGMQTFVEVGTALKEIRDSRLYRRDYSSFDKYTKGRWGWGVAHAKRLIAASVLIEELAPMGASPATERQARELGKIKDPKVRKEVWEQVIETHKPQEITAKVILETVQKPGFTAQGDKIAPPSQRTIALSIARSVMGHLGNIPMKDPQRIAAIKKVMAWCEEQLP